MDRPHHIGCEGIARRRLCYTKICYFDLPFLGYDNILRLDIPMYDMVIVCRLDSHRHLNRDTDRFLCGESDFFLNILFERDAFHKLHHDIVDPFLLAYIIYIHNVRVHEPGSSLRLHPKL